MSKIYGICNAGAGLIKKAREQGGKVTISRVLLSSGYEDERVSELFGRSLYFYDLGTATITGVNASQSLSIGISLPDSPHGALVKSFAVMVTYQGKEALLYAESDANAVITLGATPYNFTVTMSINASDVIDNFGEVEDISALAQQIAGEYLSQVSYDAESGVMSFRSQDGTRQIDINLA